MGAKFYVSASAVLCILGCVASQAIDADNSEASDQLDDISSRILKDGAITSTNNYAYQAAVLEGKRHVCGGSILNDKHVLTAAICVTNSNGNAKSASNFQVGVGEDNLNIYYFNDSMHHQVSQIIVHGQYNATTLSHNIAVIRIKDYFAFTPFVFPAKLGTLKPTESETGCEVSGWGAIWTTPAAPDMHQLHAANINVTECKSDVSVPSTGVFCGSNTNRGVCKGDTGSPLVCSGTEYTLIGIVSNSSCQEEGSVVFTSISDHALWIQETVTQDNNSGTSAVASLMLTLVLLMAFASIAL